MKKEDKEIWEKRARKYACPVTIGQDIRYIEVILFDLGGETYAITTRYIKEIIPLKDYTILPGLPSFILGIVNYRGEVISVVDIRIFLNLPERGIGELNKLIILHDNQMEFGILADQVNEYARLPEAEFRQIQATNKTVMDDFILGVTTGRIILLDAGKIIQDNRMKIGRTV